MRLTRDQLWHVKKFCLFFSIQFFLYSLLVWNTRAIAKGIIGQGVISDGVIALVSFSFVSKIVEEKKGHAARLGYVLGGMAASAFSIWLTKRLGI